MSDIEIVVTRFLDASPERVFDAWLDQEHVGNWLFATSDGQMQRVEVDPQVGGEFVIAEQRGDVLAEHFGRYVEIDRSRRLAFTFSAEPSDENASLVTVEITPRGKGSDLRITHIMRAEWADYADRTRSGWNMVLEGLYSEVVTERQAPVVTAQMLIRKPIAEVFEAFIDPAITTKFWFTRSSGRLEPAAKLRWDWEMYGASGQVSVKVLEQNKRILIEWDEPPCPVEWLFVPKEDNTTLVTISNWGFHGSDEEVMAQAIDSMGGFTSVLAGLKAWLEHGIELNLVADHHPDAHVD